ncbi:MAG: hypothetical protein ING75_17125 [Rhodocyclaceae bacterium]|nr:hypothetical protein [Rhodocyclaceae bacterium]
MAAVTFNAPGGDGSTVTDDSNPTTGLGNGGHRTRFVPALAQLVAISAVANTNATNAAASAVTAVNAPGTNGTSSTSLTVATGAQAFTTQTGKAWAVGQPVAISRTSAPATTQMFGTITAYNSGTGAMSIAVSQSKGSGTYTDWTIALTGAPAPQYSLVAVTGNVTLVANANDYFVTANAVMTFPSSPAVGDTIPFRLARSPATLTAVSFARNGSNIMGLAEDYTVDIPYLAGEWKYVDATFGWSLR